MSRYIDAEAIDRAFSKLRFNNDGELEHYGDRPNWYLWGSEVENLISTAPSIDIVRCGECLRRKSCVTFEGIADNAGFCSMGVREWDHLPKAQTGEREITSCITYSVALLKRIAHVEIEQTEE